MDVKYKNVSRFNRTPLLIAMAAVLSLVVGPLVTAMVDLTTVQHAYAKGGKSGKGGGGKGGGHSAGGGASASKGSGRGLGHQKARGLGHAKGHGDGAAQEYKGLTASALGRLNAAHAAQRARDRAAGHSAVGGIAAYQAAVGADGVDIQAAAEALARTANKPIDSNVVGAVNGLLGIEGMNQETVDAIADAAAALQAPEAVEAESGDPIQ